MINMEQTSSPPGSPGGAAPLQPMSVNQQRDSASLFSSTRTAEERDSEVHDKIRRFNDMAHVQTINTTSMSKQLERKTADAALKRAMLGREEAENEMRRYREEARALRREVEVGRERERRVGERLETVMENYGRAKETHSHTQALWEKEIRRARKEAFKSQSSIVKLQEELKTARNTIKSTEEVLAREKERSKSREQEAFEARYQLVGLQEQLEKTLERVKVAEQERDAYKTLAKNEEVARIAAEGRIPLPASGEADDEFASPKKSRVSLTTADIVSSAASEAEIDELTCLWQWEKQRAERTQEQLEFLEAECHLRCCPGAKSQSRKRRSTSNANSPRRERPSKIAIIDPADHVILGQKRESLQAQIVAEEEPVQSQTPNSVEVKQEEPEVEERKEESAPKQPRRSVRRSTRRSTIFVPSEGIFRTISQQDLQERAKEDASIHEPPSPVEVKANPPHYARTPSVEPPSFAMIAKERESLLSLLNAPHDDDSHNTIIGNIPTTAGDAPSCYLIPAHHHQQQPATTADDDAGMEMEAEPSNPPPPAEHGDECYRAGIPEAATAAGGPRPYSSTAYYAIKTTTTSVPLRDENAKPRPHTIGAMPVASANASRTPSFDVNNPALTPTMTREQALAQIRERRARSGAITPRRPVAAAVGSNGSSSSSSSSNHSTGVRSREVSGNGEGGRVRSASRVPSRAGSSRPASRASTSTSNSNSARGRS